ncbi:MAG: serine/threonine protein kinase [Polyangiales bacterium]
MTLDAPPSVRPGDVVGGKYRVERVLGAGGMGCVVVARHVRFDDRVALKVLHEEIAERPDVVERFLREGRAARQIRSEHVVQVTDVDLLDNGAPYLVMEYLDGSDLAAILHKRGQLPVETVLEWVLQACEALAEAHTRGIVHRDLKPANLFLTKRSDGSACVKVLDFGISKIADPYNEAPNLTQTANMVGTPIYMSPEQLRVAKDVDARADIWSLGVILFELLAGKPPFKADTLASLALMIALDEPASLREVRPDVPEELALVIGKCLAKERDQRYSNVGELAMALAPFAPARARISIERIGRVTGLVSRSTMPPPSEQANLPVPSIELSPLSNQPTVASPSQENQKPISLDLESVPPRSPSSGKELPKVVPTDASPAVSTIGGTTLGATESSARARLVPWIAGGALIALSGAALLIFFGGGSAPTKAPASSPSPVPTVTATEEPPPAPPPASTSAESAPLPKPSAQPSASPSSMAAKPQPKIKQPEPVGPKSTATAKPPQSKSNEDY